MFILQLLMLVPLALAGSSSQNDIDEAFDLILRTQAGQAICTHILGAQADALEAHLGMSPAAAARAAKTCSSTSVPGWLFATNPVDIRKVTLRPTLHRRYEIVKTDTLYPIESWTDNYSGATVILTNELPIPRARLVQILAHEMAVYFDSKANPDLPDARKLPPLAQMNLKTSAALDPLLALDNPLTAHTLTFVRALQIERMVLEELVALHEITPPPDFSDPYLAYLLSDRCTKVCLEHLIVNMRQDYLGFALPLVAFASHYRSRALNELPRPPIGWGDAQLARAQIALFQLPVEFLRSQKPGDSVANAQRTFVDPRDQASYNLVTSFLSYDLWKLEWPALDTTVLGDGEPLLEFMKRPLLSGYNIMLSSGPRVRVRTGNIE